MDLFSNRVPDGSFYFFTRNWTNYHDLCECRTTGTMDNWYHAIFDVGGQLGPSTYVKVDNWYHHVFPEWTTGTMPFLTYKSITVSLDLYLELVNT